MKLLYYFIILNTSYSMYMPNKLRKLKLKHESNKRQIKPEYLDEKTQKNMARLGFVYKNNKWIREERSKSNILNYVSSPLDQYEETLIKDDAASEFENEPIIFKNYGNKVKFVNTCTNMSSSIDLAQKEEYQRLGFMFDNVYNIWKRGTPRMTPLTITLCHKNRILVVKTSNESYINALHRLDYLLTQSMLESPTNVWDGGLRIARNKLFILIWFATIYKLWQYWGIQFDSYYLTDNWHVSHMHINSIYISIAIIYLTNSYFRGQLWDGSSGSISIGALEKSIADGICSNYTIAPASYKIRKSYGLKYSILASTLISIAALPRIAFVHNYIQPKLENIVLQYTPLHVYMNDLYNTYIYSIIISVLGLGLLSSMGELIGLFWARPPKTMNDEIHSIKEGIESDKIHVRMTKKRYNELLGKKYKILDQPLIMAKAIYTKAHIEATSFETVSNIWLKNFHNINSKSFPSITHKELSFTTQIMLNSFIAGVTASLFYYITEYDFVSLVAMQTFGSYIELCCPTLKLYPLVNQVNVTL